MKKILFLIIFILMFLFSMTFASEQTTVTLDKALSVKFNDSYVEFSNVKGESVYPLSYNGTTYLPIRALSSLFEISISWDGSQNAILLGEGEIDDAYANKIKAFNKGTSEQIEVLINREIKIYLNDSLQKFSDEIGRTVYPISYQGTTYLPVRAVAKLYNATIEWKAAVREIEIRYDKRANRPKKDADKTKLDPNAKWNEKYILNTDGYLEATLTKKNYGFDLYIVGLKDYKSICCRYEGEIIGEQGLVKTEDGNMRIFFNDTKMIITSDWDKYKIFEGTYFADYKSIKEIISTKEIQFDGMYTNGKIFGGMTIDIKPLDARTFQVMVTGVKDDKMFWDFAIAKMESGKIIYVSDISSDKDSEVELKIELLSDCIKVDVVDTDGKEYYNALNGTYKEIMRDFELCQNYEYSTLGESVYGEIIIKARAEYTKTENGIQGSTGTAGL